MLGHEMTQKEVESLVSLIPGDFVVYLLVERKMKVLCFTDTILSSFGVSNELFRAATADDALDVVMPGDRNYVVSTVVDKPVGTDNIQCIFRLMHKEQGFFWVHSRSRIIGTMDGYSIVLTNYLNLTLESSSYSRILDDTDKALYTVDIHTHEILYANRVAQELACVENGRVYAGHPCYEYRFLRKEPCENCPMPGLEPGESHYDEVFDSENGRWHSITVKRVQWCNHDCMEAFIGDITEKKNREAIEKMRAVQLQETQKLLKDAVSNSDVQYFTYCPSRQRAEILMLNRHYSELPTIWDNYPDSFLEYMNVPPSDADAYRNMVRIIDEGSDEAACVIHASYQSTPVWLQVHLTTERDENGRTVKVQGYSIDITSQKEAEERLQKERVRLKTMEGSTFEAFSFNITKNSQANLQTSDAGLMDLPLSDDVLHDAEHFAPAMGDPDAETRQVMLHVANRIPDVEDRRLYLSTCGGRGLRQAIKAGRYESAIRYRRRIGPVTHWVSSSFEVLPDPSSGDLIAFFYTRDINDEVIAERIAERIIDTGYLTVSYCDLQTGTLVIKASDDPADSAYDGVPYEEAVVGVCNRTVLPAEVEDCKKKFALDTIIAKLDDNPIYSVYYTRLDRDESLPRRPFRRMRNDLFYLDEHRDVIVIMLSDVTEAVEQEREAQEAMVEALRDAEAANAAKSEFLSRMSHDIRTPMNGIIGMTSIAREQVNPSETDECLTKIDMSSHFLLGLVNDILDMSKIENGEFELHPEPYPSEKLVDYINAVIRPLCEQKDIRFQMGGSFTDEVIPLFDVLRINQVLFNLLSNAVKFTPQGGTVKLSVASRLLDDGRMHSDIQVIDNGMGMSEEFQKHLFEPFSQEQETNRVPGQGTGLGLAIVKRIVDFSGGTIEVKSALGSGTTFTLHVTTDCIGAEEYRSSDRNTKGGATVDLSGRRVLLCEDNPLNREIAVHLLQQAKMFVATAEDGKRGLEIFKASAEGYFDAVLMDIRMPVMNGYETTHAIRALDRDDAKSVVIIAMTADAYADDKDKCLRAGMNAHVAKPVDPDTLYATLSTCMTEGSR